MAITAIRPGEHLAEELEALRMSAAELARQLRVPTNRVTGILNSAGRLRDGCDLASGFAALVDHI